MKRSEMRCSSKGRIWVCVSLHAGEISKSWEQELRETQMEEQEKEKNVHVSDVCVKEREPEREKLSPGRLDQK